MFELDDLEIYIKGHSPCEFMYDLYLAEIYKPWAIFAASSTGLFILSAGLCRWLPLKSGVQLGACRSYW